MCIRDRQNLPSRFILEDGRFGRSWQTGSLMERQDFYQKIVPLMKDSDAGQRKNWLMQLRSWAEVGGKTSKRHRAMTVDELRLLAANSWVTIGAHTVTH